MVLGHSFMYRLYFLRNREFPRKYIKKMQTEICIPEQM